ncbi:MAG: NADH-quinone oxidoreductase subunit M, partial [Chloroflexota bacterium]
VLISQTILHRTRDFFVLLLTLGGGVFGVFAVRDLFFLFFFYELAVLPMYLLIGVWGSSSDFGTFLRTKEYGAMKLFLYLVAGSVLVWVGILALYVKAGDVGLAPHYPTFSLADLGQLAAEGQFSAGVQMWVVPLFMVGFGVLAGLWPFHTWSPDGHVAAPTGVSMLHAGVLMKLGAYGIIRVGMVLLPEGAQFWMPVLIVLGTVNVLYGAVSAMAQRDLKYVVGYSSVSHMGYVLMGIATLHPVGLAGAVLQMFSHGIMTALMFALVGTIYDRAHIRDITVLNGLFKRMGVASFFFAIAGLTSLGLPGLSGFIAEFMVFTGAFRTYLPLAVLAV